MSQTTRSRCGPRKIAGLSARSAASSGDHPVAEWVERAERGTRARPAGRTGPRRRARTRAGRGRRRRSRFPRRRRTRRRRAYRSKTTASTARTSASARPHTQSSDATDSRASGHMERFRQRAERKQVHVEDLALARGPSDPLRPEGPQRGRHLHADERVRLELRVPAGEEKPPGEVDVLGRHPAVVTADGEHRVAAEEAQDTGDDPTRPGSACVRRIRPMIEAASRALHRREQVGAVGHVRRPGDRGDPRRAARTAPRAASARADGDVCRRPSRRRARAAPAAKPNSAAPPCRG